MLRPPKIFRIKNKRFFVANGAIHPIKSNLDDESLVREVQKGFNERESDDDDYIVRENEIARPENYMPLSHKGMYDDEINYVAKQIGLYKNGYLGTFPIDKIHVIADMIDPGIKKFGFIMNTDSSDKSGQHWIGVCYLAKNKELNYYNSVGNPPTDEFLREIKPVVDKLALPYFLKFKVNAIPRQGASYNCGYHALLFLYRMLVLKEPFKFASGYSEIRKGEADIENFKQGLKKFDFI